MEKFIVEVGGMSSEKLKEIFEDSYFLSPEYDSAIMGVNPLTGSVIYHVEEMIHITMIEQYGENVEEEEFDDAYDNCMELVYGEFNACEYLESLVAPTLFQEFLES